MNKPPVTDPVTRSQILIYQSEDGTSRIEGRLDEGTVWLSQAHIAELYQTTKQNVSLQIRNIIGEGEPGEAATVREYLTVQGREDLPVMPDVPIYSPVHITE